MKMRRLLCVLTVLLLLASMHSYAYADSGVEPADPFHRAVGTINISES